MNERADLVANDLPTVAPENDAEFVALSFLVRYPNKATRDGYGRALRQWFTWCFARALNPLDAKRVHIETWCRELALRSRESSRCESVGMATA